MKTQERQDLQKEREAQAFILPAVDIYEDEGGITMKADFPGVSLDMSMRACEKSPPRLRAPLNVPGRVAVLPISGHVELATLPDVGTPVPCLTRPGAPSLGAGIISQALRSGGLF
jgi:hypothetical protein